MDKFPGDVEMAEKLTGGDPDILTNEKFGPEEKPDISALFGEKKIPKRKRDREEMNRRSEGVAVQRKITHPRFLKESDHEIRIRQQPSSLPSTPKSPGGASPQFSCHLCSFTSSRVNVIICHTKSHRTGSFESPLPRPRILTSSSAQPRSGGARASASDTQKRKYVRKTKSLSSKTDRETEPVKRKSTKQMDKATTKKKKTDPELREKLLADWDDESDEDMEFDVAKSVDTNSIGSPSGKNSDGAIDRSIIAVEDKPIDTDDGNEIIKASEKLLRDTDKFATLLGNESPSRASRNSNNKHSEDLDSETDTGTSGLGTSEKSPATKKPKILSERVSTNSEKDVKQSSRFSCFDFDEDDIPEQNITPVRKIPRIFGEKNTSVKKEILKKFTMSQALKNDKESDETEDKNSVGQDFFPPTVAMDSKEIINAAASPKPKSEATGSASAETSVGASEEPEEKAKADKTESNDDNCNVKANSSSTELEIVEIFEVEAEKDSDSQDPTRETTKNEAESKSVKIIDETAETAADQTMEIEEAGSKDAVIEKKEDTHPEKSPDEAMSEVATTETEDETVSELAESIRGQSETSDTDGTLTQSSWDTATFVKVESSRVQSGSVEKPAPRRRGRPRKSLTKTEPTGESLKREVASKQIEALVRRDSERKTSESDSERSYTGRRRKPNKKYLHSEVFARSPDNRASRTDESQSETDEKLHKERKGRNRRGRKSSGLSAGTIKTPKSSNDQEFEFSSRTLDSSEMARVNTPEVAKSPTKIEKFDCEEKSATSRDLSQPDGNDTEGESSVSCPVDFGKKLDSGIGSPVNITKLLSSGDSESGSQQQSVREREQTIDEKIVVSSEKNDVAEAPVESATRPEDEKADQKFDPVKPKLDKLPPKKSQIKKFELSQIDLLDACSEQVAAEAEAARLMSLSGDPDAEGGGRNVEEEEVPYPSPRHVEKIVVQEVPVVAEKDETAAEVVVETSGAEMSVIETSVIETSVIDTSAIETVEAEPTTNTTLEEAVEEEKVVNQREETSEPMSVCESVSIGEPMSTAEPIISESDGTEKLTSSGVVKVDPTPQESIDTIEVAITPKEADDATQVVTPQPSLTPTVTQVPKLSPVSTRTKEKSTSEIAPKPSKNTDDEEVPVNSFQEAFLKTLHIDKRDEKDNDGSSVVVSEKASATSETVQPEPKLLVPVVAGNDESTTIETHQPEETRQVPTLNAMTEFEGIEILVQDNIVEVETKPHEETSQVDLVSGLLGTNTKDESTDTLSLDLQKIEDTLTDAVSTPSPSSEVSVPVKKREKPRIIENVTLKEPMQILKSKLMEKLPTKSTKHKLESDTARKGESKGAPKAKIMKIDSSSPNSKPRSPTKSSGSHTAVTKRSQHQQRSDETGSLVSEKTSEKSTQIHQTQTISLPAEGEKFIQQSSQSLADMELDINSMPFVLSEDVLTPESIDQMPVVISAIIPVSTSAPSSGPSSSGAVQSSLTLTPTTKLVASSPVQYKTVISESPATETMTTPTPTSTPKKKSGTPAILKNKGKAKPTITSIKTLVPPLTGGVKGLKFQSPQAGKAMPLMSQKSTPGKYVIVQGQQMRYSVQGKPGVQQKIAIPAGKGTGSAKIVHQGGKVVILTSAQSGQTKMVPLSISTSMSGKVQKIVNNKTQIFTPISGQGIVQGKTIIAPKSDPSSPTTSKLVQGQKLINTQGIITSKGVLTSISTSKCSLLGALPQAVLSKGNIYPPISSSQLAGKTIIGGKALVGKTTTILSTLSSQALGTSKAILPPIAAHTLAGKTIINAQGLVTSKGTVLKPITGQQVKAIAAKSPGKAGCKVQYQTVQQKAQLPILQKCQKLPMSPGTQMRIGGSLKSPGTAGTIVFQNTATGQKTATPGGKKIIRQIVHSGTRSPQTSVAHSVATSPQLIVSRGKSLTTTSSTTTMTNVGTITPTMQRLVPRNTGRQTKAQQKIVVQKLSDGSPGGSSPIVGIQTKATASPVGNVAKIVTSQKSPAHRGPVKSSRNAQQQKHLLNASLGTASAKPTIVSNELSASPLAPPPLTPLVQPAEQLVVFTDPAVNTKTDDTVVDTLAKDNSKNEISRIDTTTSSAIGSVEAPKIDDTKITAQPQIMALPTESSDGTQTYVLVTIDEQGQIQPLDNNTLMSLESTTQNADGSRTLYIDPSSLGEAGTIDNIVLQFDNGALPGIASSAVETGQSVVSTESFTTPEIIQTSNQDILAAALANTDFQQEIGLPENPGSTSVMTAGMTQTSLINQTILQSTIIPPTEPISSPSVLETSLTLNQPIMTPLEVPSSLPIQAKTTPSSVVTTIPTSLELPITITNPSISFIATSSVGTTASEHDVQIPGNSMPDIGEIIESPVSADIAQTDVPASARYLVIPRLNETMTIQAQPMETDSESSSVGVAYSVSIPDSAVGDVTQVQTTPSMPIIDDGYAETTERSFASDEPSVSATIVVEQSCDQPGPSSAATRESVKSPIDSQAVSDVTVAETVEVAGSEATNETSAPIVEEAMPTETRIIAEEEAPLPSNAMEIVPEESSEVTMNDRVVVSDETSELATEPIVHVQSSESVVVEASGTSDLKKQASTIDDSEAADNQLDTMTSDNVTADEMPASFMEQETNDKSALDDASQNFNVKVTFAESIDNTERESTPVVEETVEMVGIIDYPRDDEEAERSRGTTSPRSERPVKAVVDECAHDEPMEEVVAGTSQEEAPSQSYEQFEASGTAGDSAEAPTQSVGKSENSREPSQSVAYRAMEIDENVVTGEPPTQSFEDTKSNEASQSYDASTESNTNAPTQSFNEIMQCQDDDDEVPAEGIDDQSFPTQSYEVGKVDNMSVSLESDVTVSQEGNIPSQSNDVGNDGIGTSSVSTNNSGLNEDETASSSYVPETPENQERDQDQESAISTSSYEIPPCEELNIASSSVIPDTSVRGEHTSIHDNGVPEIPTSSYNLNPDSSSTSQVDALPTSSYEDRVIVEQNVSTSYEVPISMPGIEENSSQNFVTESTDHRNEPTSYYARHPEVSASYYETVNQDSNSRLEADPQEEVTPSYYENPQDVTSEASQSYFRSTPRYSSQSVSPSYYEPAPESEASQSYYSHDVEGNEQSSSTSRNVEASQSFYQETNDEIRLRQQGEATPTYTERYPVDYALANSPIERHDLVESSVPATRPTER